METGQTPQKYTFLGSGACGRVFSSTPGDTRSIDTTIHSAVYKLQQNNEGRSVKKEYTRQSAVYAAAKFYADLLQVNVPQPLRYISKAEGTWWDTHRKCFPYGTQPTPVLVSERIPPLSKKVRGEVVHRHVLTTVPHETWDFDRPTEPEAWRAWEDAQHDYLFWRPACLLRVYLRHDAWHTLRSSVHRPSNVCVMEEHLRALGIDPHQVVRKMADALAVVFWGAGMDGRGVEFIIAPPRTDEEGNIAQSNEYWESPALGSCTLWMVDFDECRPMCMCEKGIEQGVEAFLRSAPYFPSLAQDHGDDDCLGTLFVSQFKDSSRLILQTEGRWLKDGWAVGKFIGILLDRVRDAIIPKECLEEEWQSRMDSNKRFTEMWHRRCENTRDSDESESDIERKKKVDIQPYQGHIKEENNLHMCGETDKAWSSPSDDGSEALEKSGSPRAREEKTDLQRELPWLLLEDDDTFDSDSDSRVGLEESNSSKKNPGTPPGPVSVLVKDIWHLGKEMIRKLPS